ncbi:MAG TPA: hypothetical protein VLX30_07470 [Burkholderiales bacterium]|nr:hypothetical protein [Burkholderiales bacterium]
METRLTLRPGQHGTRKLVERFGERLVRVCYLYDAQTGRRLKTVELIVESDLRGRAKRLGAVWRPAQKIWEMHWSDVRRLGLTERVVES